MSGEALIGWNRGGPCLNPDHVPLHICAVCFHHTEKTFMADSETHRILNRSENLTNAALCVRCWSRLLREEVPNG